MADLRTPDTVTPVVRAQPATPTVDLRSPDAVTPVTATPAVVDRRSPDAIDLSSPRVATREPVVSISSPDSGFDWGDAGIGAGGAVAVVLLGLGAAMMATHRRRAVKLPGPVAH